MPRRAEFEFPADRSSITACVDSYVTDVCAKLICFDTTNRGNGDAEGELKAAEFVAEELAGSGIESDFYQAAPKRMNLVARVCGADPDLAAILVHAHLDVVPADPHEWRIHPFAGEVQQGAVWGRGAVDMKGACAQILALLRMWNINGVRPRRDIIVAFLADEEDGGRLGARWLIQEHGDLFSGCSDAIGEFGGFLCHVGDQRLYPIATAGRGAAWIKAVAKGSGGHGSRPTLDNSVSRLSYAVGRVSSHKWPIRLTPPVRQLLEEVCNTLHMNFDESKAEETISYLQEKCWFSSLATRNSAVPTVLAAGQKVNSIPPIATALFDGRYIFGTFDEFIGTIRSLLGDQIEWEIIRHILPFSAPPDTAFYRALASSLQAEDPSAVVLPYCMGGFSDAASFSHLGLNCYGFTPTRGPDGFDFRTMAHGVNERMPIDGLQFGVRVLHRLLSRV